VAFDAADTLEPTSRFVIVHGHDIAGCGIALEALEDTGRGDVTGRRFRRGAVTEHQRATRYGHAGKGILFVAESNESAHDIAARVERSIFARGVHSFCLSATDLGDPKDVLDREAHLGRVGEIAWAMTDAGIVLVAALGDVDRFDLDRLRRLAAPHEVFVVGVDAGAEVGADLELSPAATADEAAEEALHALAAAGVLPATD
jgi:bifunctional enzyme CysN/CysC